MKIIFDLYSVHANCKHCINSYRKMDQSGTASKYCGIVASIVDDDYYCSFYHMKPVKISTLPTTVDASGKLVIPEDKTKPKKL